MKAFQRWHLNRSRPQAERAPASSGNPPRPAAELLYTRRGLGFWIGLACSIGGSAVGLRAAGLPWWLALACSVAVIVGLLFSVLGAWLQPDRFSLRVMSVKGVQVLGLAYLGALAGFMVGWLDRPGPRTLEGLRVALIVDAWNATPVLAVVGVGGLLMLGGVASMRRQQMQRALTQLQLTQERDAAARQAAQAQLRLLQAQIQPHFLFNTLAAMQHWVNVGDPRAAPLLRSLTAFLRGSTELLGRSDVTLGQECDMVRHYLAIMQARFGERLRFQVDVPEECSLQELPPGLLITLVENAVEHGTAPQLRGGEVQVRARLLDGVFALRVLDDGAGLLSGWSDGVGLANSRERLRHQFGARAELTLSARTDGPGTQALVRVAPVP